ncbi:MAG: transcription termination factor NusA [Parcubacteria group bacterium]
MLDTKQFISAMHQIAEEKGIPENKILETIEMALAAAYKKDYGEKGQIIRAKLNSETGDVEFTRAKIVIEGADDEGFVIGTLPDTGYAGERESRADRDDKSDKKEESKEKSEDTEEVRIKFNPEKHEFKDELKGKDKKLNVGSEIVSKLESKTDFGRIAAQTAKQVIIQRLREIERVAILDEFRDKEGEVISGVAQRIEGRVVYVDLGRTNGVLPPSEQIHTEHYRIGQRARFYIVRVEETNKGPAVILSRSHPKLVIKLFEFEVPEMEDGSIEIKAIAREAGSRSKVAVASYDESVDPIGSLVGQKGVRVQTVINELGGEKIDIIEWSEEPDLFIGKALSPAKVLDVKIIDEENKHALAEVAEDQFSLAIGKRGQNVRLAAKLTGWKLDVRGPQDEMSSDEAFAGEGGEAVVKSEEKPEEEPKEEESK